MSAPQPNHADRAVAFAIFAGLTLLGLAVGAFAVRDFARARASLDWPVVEAIVLEADRSGGALRYVYSVGGESHESRRQRFVTAMLTPMPPLDAEPGDAIEVSVDPLDPGIAVVAPGGAGSLFALMAAFSALCVFVGLGGLIRTAGAPADAQGSGYRPEPAE